MVFLSESSWRRSLRNKWSYIVILFLVLLGAASLRIVQIMFELIAFPWMLAMLEDWRKHERGSLPGPIELGIIMYISSEY